MRDDKILLAHGSGGKLSHDLVSEVFLSELKNPLLAPLDDSARIENRQGELAFTTDSYVVSPIVFPGGDIGKLAVCGTVNDLSMIGADPSYLSLSLIIEEGFSIYELRRIINSLRRTADEAGVAVVTGDTKVVEHGAADKLFVNTSGIGWIKPGVRLSSRLVRPGDAVILNGPLGDHETAILSQRQGFELEGELVSDCAPLNHLVREMLEACPTLHCLRDLTRGGLASALNEIAESSQVGIIIEEDRIPIREPVKGVCELWGLDPLYLANEGKLIAFCPADKAQQVLEVVRSNALGKNGVIIGRAVKDHSRRVVLRTAIRGHRILDMLSGGQYPRIC